MVLEVVLLLNDAGSDYIYVYIFGKMKIVIIF